MNEITIDKDIPLPRPRGRGKYKYPFLKMEIGDSFFCVEKQSRVASAAASYAASYKDRKFATRQEGDGVRVWRIA